MRFKNNYKKFSCIAYFLKVDLTDLTEDFTLISELIEVKFSEQKISDDNNRLPLTFLDRNNQRQGRTFRYLTTTTEDIKVQILQLIVYQVLKILEMSFQNLCPSC